MLQKTDSKKHYINTGGGNSSTNLKTSWFLCHNTMKNIEFSCLHCGKELSVSAKFAGKKGKCPKCKGAISIPGVIEEPTESNKPQAKSSQVNKSKISRLSQLRRQKNAPKRVRKKEVREDGEVEKRTPRRESPTSTTMAMIKSTLQALFFGLILVASIAVLNNYWDGQSKYEKLLGNNKKVVGVLDQEYTETNIELEDNTVKQYEFGYSFTVDNQKYSGTYSHLNEVPESRTVNVYYLPDDPTISSLDPKRSLAAKKGSIIVALIAIFLSFLLMAHGIYKIRKIRAKSALLSQKKSRSSRSEMSSSKKNLVGIVSVATIILAIMKIFVLGAPYQEDKIKNQNDTEVHKRKIDKSIRVLFLGNSLISVNNLPGIIARLAEGDNNQLVHESSTPGGCKLAGHASNPNLDSILASQKWDFVVLQEQSQLPSFAPRYLQKDVYPPARELNRKIKTANQDTQVVFFMTMANRLGDIRNIEDDTYKEMQKRLNTTYLKLAEIHSATAAPVGVAFEHVLEHNKNIKLYADDVHPNGNGSYLAACVFYAVFFQKSPKGLSYTASLNPQEARVLQKVAHDIVFSKTWKFTEKGQTTTPTGTDSPMIDDFSQSSQNYRGSNSYGRGGSFEIAEGELKLTPGKNNTYSVVQNTPTYIEVGETWSIEVLSNRVAKSGIFFIVSSSDKQPNGSTSFGLRLRVEDKFKLNVLSKKKADIETEIKVPPAPYTLSLTRTSKTDFSFRVNNTFVVAATLQRSDVAGKNFSIGVEAFTYQQRKTFRFDNLMREDFE